jgi:hypothetical protein
VLIVSLPLTDGAGRRKLHRLFSLAAGAGSDGNGPPSPPLPLPLPFLPVRKLLSHLAALPIDLHKKRYNSAAPPPLVALLH